MNNHQKYLDRCFQIAEKGRGKIILCILCCLISQGCNESNNNKSFEQTQTFNGGIETIKNHEILDNHQNLLEPMKIDSVVKMGNIKITLRYTDSIFINKYVLDKNIIDSLITPYDNRHEEALEIEKYLLKFNSNFVKRDSNGLHIKLVNNDWKLIPLNLDMDESDNTFEYYFKDLGFYSIRTQSAEGNGYKLISHYDGKIINLIGRPYFSPNAKYLMAISLDIDAGYNDNGLQLFQNNNGKIKLIGYYDPVNWGVTTVKWLDDEVVILKASSYNQNFYIKCKLNSK